MMITEEKKHFAEPACEIERFSVADILTTSDDGNIPPVDNWETDEF